jgi:hypothetical protein
VFHGELIGREQEMALLDGRWAAAANRGSVMMFRSEPGMGKTRLVSRFRGTVGRAGVARVMRCSVRPTMLTRHCSLCCITSSMPCPVSPRRTPRQFANGNCRGGRDAGRAGN